MNLFLVYSQIVLNPWYFLAFFELRKIKLNSRKSTQSAISRPPISAGPLNSQHFCQCHHIFRLNGKRE